MKQALTRALTAYPAGTRTLVIAYSGGRDSTALLHALARADLSVALRVVHVCHHLEADAISWAAQCEHQCAALGVAFSRCDVSVGVDGGGLEAAARQARYAALAERLGSGEVLVTAHHADDQAETFLLQALRGAGLAGLAGMPVLTAFGAGRLWRPWLSMPRAEITAYVRAHDLDWIEDATNNDPRRARGYLRSRVWPALIQRWPAAARTLTRSAGWAGQAVEAIDALAGFDLTAARSAGHALCIEKLCELSMGRQAEVLRRWLAEAGADRPDHRHVAEIQRLLGAREHAGPRVTFAATEVRRFDGRLFAMPRLPEPPTPGCTVAWPAPGRIELPPGCGSLSMQPTRPPERPSGLCLVFGRSGQRLTTTNSPNELLSEYLRRARVPPWVRQRLPRVHAGDSLLAVPGLWWHPHLAQWFGGAMPVFDWRHDLVGDPGCGTRTEAIVGAM